MILDAVVSLGGLILPPAFDFFKKKFVKEANDTPERTMGSLAATSPEVLPGYVGALVKLQEAKVKHYNRDVIGEPSPWVVDLRASIRPVCVVVGLCFLVGGEIAQVETSKGVALFFEAVIGSWFGHRISVR